MCVTKKSWTCLLQPRHGISTGLATSVSLSRKATQTRSRKAAQTRTVREAKHRRLNTLGGTRRTGTAKQRAEHSANELPSDQTKTQPEQSSRPQHITSQTLPNFARGSGARATPLAPRVAQREAGHRGLHPAVVLVEDSAPLLQQTIDEPLLGEQPSAVRRPCVRWNLLSRTFSMTFCLRAVCASCSAGPGCFVSRALVAQQSGGGAGGGVPVCCGGCGL